MKILFKVLAYGLIVNFLTSCGHNQLDIDTSKVEQEPVLFKRLDKDVFLLTPENSQQKMVDYQKKYSTFYKYFYSKLVNTSKKINGQLIVHNLPLEIICRNLNNSKLRNFPQI